MHERPETRSGGLGGTAVFTLLLFALSPNLEAQPSSDFVPLFDGASLQGWVVENTEAGNFSVQGGVLRAEGPSGWLRTERQFADFTLRAEFRFLSADSDSGIFLRADGVTPFIRGWPGNSYQVQIRDITTNRSNNPIWLADVYRHRVAEGGETAYDSAAALEASRPTGEWQEIEIEVAGDRLAVRLNGVQVTRAENIVNPRGYIGIQGETGVVEYRSIQLREQ
jgi:hypothetical protein